MHIWADIITRELAVLALVSLGVALMRALATLRADSGGGRPWYSRVLRRLPLRDMIGLAVVCVVVATPMSYTLHERHSVGPTGYAVWDPVGYLSETDGMVQQSIRQTQRPQPANANFTRLVWSSYAAGVQNLDAVPLSANVNELLGLHATDTHTLFLIVFLMSGALGAFAAVRYALPKPSWAAPFAGILFAGPFFLQLMADGSQAATCGLALLLPLAAVGADAVRSQRFASLVLVALLASGLMALYPVFVPGVTVAAAVCLLVLAAMAWWRGQLTRRVLAWASVRIGIVVALSAVFNLVSFTRDVRYWRGLVNNTYFIAGFPQYHLPYSVLPGWLLQTREFYSLTELGSAPPKEILLGVVLPGILIAVIIFGLRRRQAGLILLPLFLICLLLAENTSAVHNCSYCTDRTLLPIAPLSIGLLALGVGALATAQERWMRWAGIVVALVALVAVGQRTRQERLRFADGAYFLDAGDRSLVAHLPVHPGPVEIEAYGEDPLHAPGELPLIYLLVSERNREQASVPSEYTDYSSLAYFGGPNHANPQLNPGYRYVLTRLGSVQTGRRVIARTGSLALEERTSALDGTVVTGLALPSVRLDAQGLAWVVGPLHLLAIGGGPGPVWISLRLRTIVPVTVPSQPGVKTRSTAGGILTACVRATGSAPVRRGTIQIGAALLPGLVPSEPFALSEPAQGIQLVAMRAVTHCSLSSAS